MMRTRRSGAQGPGVGVYAAGVLCPEECQTVSSKQTGLYKSYPHRSLRRGSKKVIAASLWQAASTCPLPHRTQKRITARTSGGTLMTASWHVQAAQLGSRMKAVMRRRISDLMCLANAGSDAGLELVTFAMSFTEHFKSHSNAGRSKTAKAEERRQKQEQRQLRIRHQQQHDHQNASKHQLVCAPAILVRALLGGIKTN